MKRFDIYDGYEVESEEGKYITYEDHLEELKILQHKLDMQSIKLIKIKELISSEV